MKPVPCISFFNHSYFAVVKSFIGPFVEPVSYDGFIIISLDLFVNRFYLKNHVFASIRIFSQYKLSVFIYFSQSYLGFFFAIFILNFLYSVIFYMFPKKERGKIEFSIFPLFFLFIFSFLWNRYHFFTAGRYMAHCFKQISLLFTPFSVT